MGNRKRVFVSGCFDLLHSGHVRFLEEAARYGELHVGIGSDETVKVLKGRYPVTTQEERKYLLESLRYVKACYINCGSGILDFLQEFKRAAPSVFVVNEDGNTPAKARLCRKLGIEYIVLDRRPRARLPVRSSTSLRTECRIPYRLDLAGGWLDQPFVSKHGAGPVLTISVEPTLEFNERSGMASSSRRRAVELWHTEIPGGDREKLARVLFSYENPPGTTQFSGSQDAIGIVFPGLNRLDYRGAYWPEIIRTITNRKILKWLEVHIQLVTLGPRKSSFAVLKQTRITAARVGALARAANQCWDAILCRNLTAFGRAVRDSFSAQAAMFPGMVDKEVETAIGQYRDRALGWKLAGAGGGGYLVLVTRRPIAGAIRLKIRRPGL